MKKTSNKQKKLAIHTAVRFPLNCQEQVTRFVLTRTPNRLVCPRISYLRLERLGPLPLARPAPLQLRPLLVPQAALALRALRAPLTRRRLRRAPLPLPLPEGALRLELVALVLRLQPRQPAAQVGARLLCQRRFARLTRDLLLQLLPLGHRTRQVHLGKKGEPTLEEFRI